MELKKLGNNETQVNQNGYLVLYSYSTPVAIRHHSSGKEWHSSKKRSNTTTKHINKWKSIDSVAVTQETLEKILKIGYVEALQYN